MDRRGFHQTVAVFSGGGTGGHLYPSLALAEELSVVRPDVRVFFVGARRGVEARILPERGLDHLLLPILGFRRGRLLPNLGVVWGLLKSVLMTGELFTRLRPGVVVVTGGYASGPAGLVARAMGIPLAVQEQNARPGFTTRFLSRWCRQIHLAFPEALDWLPPKARDRAHMSGNPIRRVDPLDPQVAREGFGLKPRTSVVLVVGGSQGSEALNRAVLEFVETLAAGKAGPPKDVEVLWATGPNNLDHVEGRLADLGNPGWIHAVGYIHEMRAALSAATVAVSRAGAMTTSELSAWGVPSVLVPLPTAAADHQTRNAESLARAGSAVHIPEAELTGSRLWNAVDSLLSSPQRLAAMKAAALEAGRPEATREITRALERLLPRPIGTAQPAQEGES